MNLIPAVLAVHHISAGHTDVISHSGNPDLGDESRAYAAGSLITRGMLADYLNYKSTLGVQYIDEVQDRFLLGLEPNVQVTVYCAVDGSDTALDGRAGFGAAWRPQSL